MLHILLCILKIVGWILLVILGMVILIVGIFLFEPVRYQCDLNIKKDFKAVFVKVKFHWLFRMIRGQVLYEKERVSFQLKIGWKSYPTDGASKSQEQKEEKGSTNIKKRESLIEADLKENPSSIQREEEGGGQERKEEKEKKEKEEKRDPKKNSTNKVQRIFDKIQYTFRKICATMNTLQKKKEYLQRFLKSEVHKNAWDLCLLQVKSLLRKTRPKKVSGIVEYGTEDPAFTGQILALISMIYPFIGDQIQIIPDFNEKKINADVCVVGKIRSVFFLYMLTRLFLNKEVRITCRHIKKLINRM